MHSVISILISFLILFLVFAAIVWIIGWIGVPEPWNKGVKIVIGIIFLLILLGMVTGGISSPVYLR